jgi:hypothetical protein
LRRIIDDTHDRDTGDPWLATEKYLARELLDAREELDRHREAAAYMYQYAGATDAPVEVLDNLSAIAQEERPPHEWKYPAGSATFDRQREELEAARAALKLFDRFAEYARYELEDEAMPFRQFPAKPDCDHIRKEYAAYLAKYPREGR